MSKFRFC